MIRKPTNLLLTKMLKTALVELTAAESNIQLTFSQVELFLENSIIEIIFPVLFLLSKACTNLYQHITLRKRHALFRRLHCRSRSVRAQIEFVRKDMEVFLLVEVQNRSVFVYKAPRC